VGLEVPETLLNLHPFPVKIDDEVGLQEASVSSGNQQIPGFFIGWIIIHNHIHGDSPLGVIENILIPKRFSRRCGKVTQFHPFPLVRDDRLLASPNNIRPLLLLTLLEQQGASIGPVSDPDSRNPWRQSGFRIEKEDMFQLILTFEGGFAQGVSKGVTR
jgi:hypothetical protein